MPIKSCIVFATASVFTWIVTPGSVCAAARFVTPIASTSFQVDDTDESNQLKNEPSWKISGDESIEDSLRSWLRETNTSAPITKSAIEIFRRSNVGDSETASAADDRLKRLINAIGSTRPDVAKIAAQLSRQRSSVLPPTFSHILDNEAEHPFVRAHVRLLVGRWLAQNKFYDEALAELTRLEPKSVLIPEAALFYRSLAEHQLLKTEDCKHSIESLLENEDDLPTRFSVVAKMMLADISPIKDGSLDEISRLMKDVYRRINFQRSGKTVLQTEEQVIEKLNNLIEEAEQKQQQAQSQSQPADGNQQSSNPMEETKIAGGTGDGSVTTKPIDDGGLWGDMPAAERAAAMAEMAKDMPPHYRAAIEQYFRRLAKEETP